MSEYTFRVVLVGDPSVGKTSIILRFVDNVFVQELVSTNAAKTKTRALPFGKRTVHLALTDTVGQERFRTISRSMYREADAVIIVYDQANEKSFSSLKFWLNEVEKYANSKARKFVVCGKTDLNAVVPVASGKAYAEELRVPFVEVSAKTDSNVDALFQTIVQSLGERDYRGEDWSKFKISSKSSGGSSSSIGSAGGSSSNINNNNNNNNNSNTSNPPKKKSGFCILL